MAKLWGLGKKNSEGGTRKAKYFGVLWQKQFWEWRVKFWVRGKSAKDIIGKFGVVEWVSCKTFFGTCYRCIFKALHSTVQRTRTPAQDTYARVRELVAIVWY